MQRDEMHFLASVHIDNYTFSGIEQVAPDLVMESRKKPKKPIL